MTNHYFYFFNLPIKKITFSTPFPKQTTHALNTNKQKFKIPIDYHIISYRR